MSVWRKNIYEVKTRLFYFYCFSRFPILLFYVKIKYDIETSLWIWSICKKIAIYFHIFSLLNEHLESSENRSYLWTIITTLTVVKNRRKVEVVLLPGFFRQVRRPTSLPLHPYPSLPPKTPTWPQRLATHLQLDVANIHG